MAKITKADRDRQVANLKKWTAEPEYRGQVIIIYKGRSASGLSRYYSVHMIGDGRAIQLNWACHVVCGYRFQSGDRDGIVVNGFGFSGHQDIADNIRHAIGDGADKIQFIEL